MIGGGFRGSFPEKGKGGEYKPRVGIVRNPQAMSSHPAELGPRVLHNPFKEQVDKKAPKGPAYEHQVSWNGVIHGYSGYAKANREIIKRLASFIKVGLGRKIPWNASEKDSAIYGLYMYYNNIPVENQAPSVTFNPPQVELESRYRIIYTMMETEIVHPDMIRVMNENYRECWTPTYWNAQTFRRGGLSIPVHVMPLGVDPSIYAPSVVPKMPEATLVTTSSAGRLETPKGFTFISVGQPTFRKGYDVLLQAFEEAFYGDNTVALVLGTTDYSIGNLLPRKDMTTRVYALTGTYSERELASIYKACQVYISCSRGEGYNMPAVESAAVGLPIILSRVSVHPEIVPDRFGNFFDADGVAPWSNAGAVSTWFEGIPFPVYGHNSKQQIIGLMKKIRKNYTEATEKSVKFSAYVRSRMTWGTSARLIADRIKALHPE